MTDVGRKAGVSAMTVSRALRDDGSVSEATRLKVRQAIEELGYVLDRTAGSLSSRRPEFIACLISSISDPSFSDIARGITSSLEAADLQLILGHTQHSLEREEKLVQAMLEHRLGAFIITAGDHSVRTRKMLQASGLPVIEMLDIPQQPIGHVVGFSNADACGDMVKHLYARGYRKLGFLGSTTNRDVQGTERKRGFVKGVAALGLDTERIVSIGSPTMSMQQSGVGLAQLVKRWPDTDAVVCASDLVAFGAITECARRDWAVPGRIAVAGFGDFAIAKSCHPSITTVRVDWFGIGATAGQVAVQGVAAMQSDEILPNEFIRPDYRIVERQST